MSKELSFLADLSGIDLSVVYSLSSVVGDSRDVYFDLNSSEENISDEEVEQILKNNGFISYKEKLKNS